MSKRAKELSLRLQALTDEVVGFVQRCSDTDWIKVCKEDWTVGVTARHIGAGHFRAVGLAKMIVSGERLPEMTMPQLIDMANEHARQHAGCTREEVLDVLRQTGATLVGYVADLSDADLDRTGHMALMGGQVSAQRLLEAVVLGSSGEHLSSMKAAVAG
ncbi:MAG: DinB family protein [Hyphomicrobiales bacterium]